MWFHVAPFGGVDEGTGGQEASSVVSLRPPPHDDRRSPASILLLNKKQQASCLATISVHSAENIEVLGGRR